MKIISGGQTGADQAGLAAAKELGIETGGWLPKGCTTADGPRPDLLKLYGMKEHPQRGYPPRTERNVLDSDGTIMFGDYLSPGCKLTAKFCARYNKPILTVSFFTTNPHAANEDCIVLISNWIAENNIYTLNVAGNRESKNPGIFEFTRDVLLRALRDR